MERDFNTDDFELFLKQKADQHKLFPSDKVWRGINNSLHPGLKWIKIGGSLLVVTALVFIFQETNFSSTSKTSGKEKLLSNAPKPVTPEQPAVNAPITSLQTMAFPPVKGKTGIISFPSNRSSAGVTPVFSAEVNKINALAATQPLKGFVLHNNDVLKENVAINVAIPGAQPALAQQDEKRETVFEKELATSAVSTNTASNEENISLQDFNWLQEIAAIKLTPQKKSKFNLQFYFSPTISYRRLVDNQNNSHTSQNIPIAPRDLNVNNYIDQNASIGAELGSNVLFSVGRNFTIKSGLQLNYSRYNIKAFKFYYEKASIALNTSGPVADTISSYTSYRNFNGYSPELLQNQYLQVSVPVGAELKLLGNKRLQLNVAGSIQPTFLLFSDTYLLSSNYLNYTKEPSLVRKWNVHSSFEAFLSYKIAGLRWQLGPQFRYQLLSSYYDRYPIKEYLFEYGVKIGVSKTFRK